MRMLRAAACAAATLLTLIAAAPAGAAQNTGAIVQGRVTDIRFEF
jgi:hypothetical protein